MRSMWMGLAVVLITGCAVKGNSATTQETTTGNPSARCVGTRYVTVYNGSRYAVDVFAGSSNPQLLGTVDQGRGAEFPLPTGATSARTRTTAPSPTASGTAGKIRLMYSCRR